MNPAAFIHTDKVSLGYRESDEATEDYFLHCHNFYEVYFFLDGPFTIPPCIIFSFITPLRLHSQIFMGLCCYISPFWRIQECLYILFLILSHANYFCQIMTYNKILSSIFLIYISNLCFNSLYIKISTSVSTQ